MPQRGMVWLQCYISKVSYSAVRFFSLIPPASLSSSVIFWQTPSHPSVILCHLLAYPPYPLIGWRNLWTAPYRGNLPLLKNQIELLYRWVYFHWNTPLSILIWGLYSRQLYQVSFNFMYICLQKMISQTCYNITEWNFMRQWNNYKQLET